MDTLLQLMGSDGLQPTLPVEVRSKVAHVIGEHLGFDIYPDSIAVSSQACFCLGRNGQEKQLVVLSTSSSLPALFEGEHGLVPANSTKLHCCVGPTSSDNARKLRNQLPFLQPRVLGLQQSAGCGDRLGLATPGHIAAMREVHETGRPEMALIAAQQSVRENGRTGRTPQQVIDDAMWGVFEAGWRAGYGADADHLKQPDDVAPWVEAGFTFYTIDPGDHVDDEAEHADLAQLQTKVAALPWEVLDSDPEDLLVRLGRPIDLGTEQLTMNETEILRAAAKYGKAVAHTVRMYRHIKASMAGRPFELEVSVDETATVTRIQEHVYIAAELKRQGVEWVSLAPRYVGAFEKGVDYIGDPEEFRSDFARHVAVAQTFGPYKLSLHSGSDKFTIYPIAAELAGGLVHLKTAGTSYLEALRTVAHVNPDFFREIMEFAVDRFEVDRASYHVSGSKARIPALESLDEDGLAALIDQFDARQALHVTFGSVLQHGTFRDRLYQVLREHEVLHYEMLARHFVKHLAPFISASNGADQNTGLRQDA